MKKVITAFGLVALIGLAAACNRQGNANNGAGAPNGANASAAAGNAQQGAAAGEAEVRALLDRIYAPYASDDARDIDIAGFMEPQLAQAMARSEEGPNADPFIAAQDYSAFRPTYEGISVNGDRAQATAAFTNMGNQTRVEYHLVRAGGDWKIADIRSANGGSFRSQYALPALP